MEFAWQSIRSEIRGVYDFDALRTRIAMEQRGGNEQCMIKDNQRKSFLTWSISLSSLTILGTGTFTPLMILMARSTDSVLRQKKCGTSNCIHD